MTDNKKFLLVVVTMIVVVFSVVGLSVQADVHTRHHREAACTRLGGVDGWKYDRHLCLDRRTGAVLSTWEELDHR